MRTRTDRDETTLQIMAGVVRFASVLLLAAGVLIAMQLTTGLPDVDGRATFYLVLALAAWWAVRGTTRSAADRPHQG